MLPHVIIVGLESGEHGFPCKIENDAVLNLVLTKQEKSPYANAEERRVFYDAMTRAKKHVYLLVTDENNISEFVSEIEKAEYKKNIARKIGESKSCPLCKTGENNNSVGIKRSLLSLQ